MDRRTPGTNRTDRTPKRARKPTRPTPKKGTAPAPWPAVLEALARAGSIKAACEAAGVGRRTFYNRRDANAEFAKAAGEAIERWRLVKARATS